MRRCCCCVSVHWGAACLGLLGVLLAALELAVLVPFLMNDESFNPIEEHLNSVLYVMESLLEESGTTEDAKKDAIALIQSWLWMLLLIEACLAVLYAIVAALMTLGVGVKRRPLMLPYLIVQMLLIVVFVLSGLVTCVALFFVNIIMGTIAVGVWCIATFLMLYFWVAVQKAYKELGNRDYMYVPTPVKPIYNPRDGGGAHYHHQLTGPSAPHQFQLE